MPNHAPASDDVAFRCVVGVRTEGVGRLEHKRCIVDDREVRPTIHFAQDQGSIGWAGIVWEIYKTGIRATASEGEWHRYINDVGEATRQSGCWTLVLEWGIVANFRGDPWKGASFQQTVMGACEGLFRDCSIHDQLFKLLYERMACDFNVQHDLDFGSECHRRKVFDLTASHKCW